MPSRRTLALAFSLASLAWAGALVAVPYLLARRPALLGVRPVASIVYLTGGAVCHQRGDRSFHPWGTQMPVCARCVGLYAAAPVGAGLSLVAGMRVSHRRHRRATVRAVRRRLVVAALPTVALVLTEWAGLSTPGALVRFGAAMPLGAAVAWVVATAIREEIR